MSKLLNIKRRYSGLIVAALVGFGLPLPALAVPYSAFVSEPETDRVLYAANPDELRHPASLTKMMTLYLVFEGLARGELKLDTPMTASAFAVSKPPSRLGLKPGDTLTVEEGILGLVTQSANDAATVIAEHLAGSEPAFAQMMTQKAQQLGMSNTVFRNAQGLPDPDQWTTARDMYKLGKALIKNFPQYYTYFGTQSFPYQGRDFHNHNHLLGKYPGADGIKTGFINSSGFNLVASAKRNNVRLVGVVFGGPTHSRRDARMVELLDDGFAQMEGQPPAEHLAGFDAPPKPVVVAQAPVAVKPLKPHAALKPPKALKIAAKPAAIPHKTPVSAPLKVAMRSDAHPPKAVKVAVVAHDIKPVAKPHAKPTGKH